ncbi:hypothetical protein GCM10010259_36630 [Streptomyces daghestanicus]|uniref:Uncharacterized protein n=2 Tax=Streptomyces TaxID=1883 RepID=A0A918GH25_STRGD|nr:hypothetical protein GCM10010238_25880 [Streptomyces niveoruber]GGS97955.1 hypothetical protein GCM10010240_34150 [Streptomyces griseoviridis]GGU42418.1 hypothetical protein GCM10010259_36630 [Streptomyces daghestanicus]GHI28730.1 hypothetical protein Sdagh_04600 [Streptomyces daghestanicus]
MSGGSGRKRSQPEPKIIDTGEHRCLAGVLIASGSELRHHRREMLDTTQLDHTESDAAPRPQEPRGCLFALSQPPLMIFLAVIGCLLLMASLHDLLLL